MSSYNPGLVLPVVVTTSNKWIDFTYNTSLTYAAQITAGTYYSLASVAAAVDTAFQSIHTVGWTVDFHNNALAQSGWSIQIETPAGLCALKFATGAHASSCAYSILGFGATDHDATDVIISDYNVPNVWVSNRAPASDTYDRRKHVGGEARESINGAHHVRLAVARPRMRKVEFENIAKQRTLDVHATGAYTNMAFESFWERAITGEYFAYYNDWTICATAANSSGNYYLMEPDDMMDIKRTHVGTEVYTFGITMQRKE